MITIQQYIASKVEGGTEPKDIAVLLGVSVQMVSAYKLHAYNPSLDVAKRVYTFEEIVLHPFAKESLIKEIQNDKKETTQTN